MLWDDHFSVKSWSVPLPSSITMISIANQFNSYKDNHKNGKYSNTTLKVYLMYYCRIDLDLWICIDIFIWYLRFDAPHHIRDKYMERYFDYQNYSKYKVPSLDAFDRNNVDDVLNFIRWFFWFLKLVCSLSIKKVISMHITSCFMYFIQKNKCCEFEESKSMQGKDPWRASSQRGHFLGSRCPVQKWSIDGDEISKLYICLPSSSWSKGSVSWNKGYWQTPYRGSNDW